MTDHEFSSMDFEEGEVDDNSESDVDTSPLEFSDKKRRYEFKRNPNRFSSETRSHSRRDKHQSKHKHDKKSQIRPRHKPPLPTKSNGHGGYENRTEKEFSRSRHIARRPSLKDYVSEDEVDFHVSEREKLAKHYNLEDRRKRKRRRIERPASRTPQTQCRYFMEGRCHKGESCPYAHDFVPPKKQELCKFYAVGVCSKGSSCLYLHEEFPCKFFHLSGKCNHGDSCKFSHLPLTSSTRALLDRIAPTKDSGLLENDHSFAEHGDIDYRFGPSNPPLHPGDSYDCPSGQRNLFAPNFPSEERVSAPCSNVEFRERMDPHPSLLRLPINDGPVRPYRSDSLLYRPAHPFGPAPLPLRYPGPGNLPPPPLPIVNNQCLRNSTDGRLRLQTPLPTKLGPPMYDVPEWHPELAPFRPPFVPPPGSVPFPPVYPNGGAPSKEAIVSSELDKMAALLAASKPPTNRSSTNSVDPRTIQAPTDPRSESGSVLSDDVQITHVQNPVPSDENSQRRPSLSFSSPELNVVPSKPAGVAPAIPIPWRLIPLDMTVKIPYPLMQLSIEDLPHRFEDPRLRGQLTAFRTHLKPAVQLDEIGVSSAKTTDVDPQMEPPNSTPLESQEKTESTQRRPFKLQLNEMASTFSANSFTPVASTNRSGDRSYLDDPRFRRRRIVTCVSTSVVTQDTVTTSVSENSLDSEHKNQPEV
ncbi:Zinc finger CCCH domain-containing protein 6 [Fasciola hepatica]|uniref:Zinc finger CCCH domain-containing protein 6 n=1 Tax=Fasciola hepatica TaxID=6192 RepID=A0A4E0R511_FASHE|nr:Zinc finger CCCH domain-containing protein 6 [Fasciola hepatica]